MSGNPVRMQDIDALVDDLNRRRVRDDSRMQCKVCWYVYDPKEGCLDWDVPPGTPFRELPEYFTCPGCGNEKTGFLLMADDPAEDEA